MLRFGDMMMPEGNIWRDCYDPFEPRISDIAHFSALKAVLEELAHGFRPTGRKLLHSLRGERNPALNKHEK